jgi:hypothetical protein
VNIGYLSVIVENGDVDDFIDMLENNFYEYIKGDLENEVIISCVDVNLIELIKLIDNYN